jgi:hypothetical protein
MILLYPNQLKVVDNGNLMEVIVKQSYFKSHYLIKAVLTEK